MVSIVQPASKLALLKEKLAQSNIDLLICLKPENTFHLSGFNPIIYSHPVVVLYPRVGEPALLVHALRDDHARSSSSIPDVRLYGAWSTKQTMGPNWLDALRKILEEKKLTGSSIGLELDSLSVERYEQLRALLPQATMQDASPLLLQSRTVKDAEAIANARIAARFADAGMARAIEVLGQGGTEREVSIEAMHAMNTYWNTNHPEVEVCAFGSLEGGVQNSLWCWCLSGKRVLLNCDSPSTRRPEPGEIALIYIWAVANGVYVENERSVAVGKLAAEQQHAYNSILDIRQRTQPLIRPGARVADLFLHAKRCYQEHGLDAYLPGRIGHGMGLGAHEEPSLDGKSDLLFEPGMMFTFEPNLRVPEWGGLQHSDTLLITEDGYESLTTTSNGFLQVRA